MNVITASHECKIIEVVELQYVDVGNGMAAYKLAQYSKTAERNPGKLFEHATKAAKSNFKPHYQEGFCLLADAVSVAENKAPRGNLFKQNPLGNLMMVTQQYLDALLKYSVHAASASVQAQGQIIDTYQGKFKFQQVVDGTLDMSKYQPVFFDGRTNMVYNKDGEWVAMGLMYDYMHGQMDNTVYDLPRVLEHLKQHPQVRFLEVNYSGQIDPRKDSGDPQIASIPYYNVYGKRHAQLAFMFMPTQEQMITLQSLYKENYLTFEGISRIVASLDLMGIEQFRISEYGDDDEPDDQDD